LQLRYLVSSFDHDNYVTLSLLKLPLQAFLGKGALTTDSYHKIVMNYPMIALPLPQPKNVCKKFVIP